MREAPFTLELNDQETTFDFKSTILKYAKYWYWFAAVLLTALVLGFLYLRYTPIIYQSTAKIKIIDDSKELDMTADALSVLSGNSKINLENEQEVLKSYRLLSKVVSDLNLNVSYYKLGNVKTTQIWDPPFTIATKLATDSILNGKVFKIKVMEDGLILEDEDENINRLAYSSLDTLVTNLPFHIGVPNMEMINEELQENFEIRIQAHKEVVLDLIKDLQLQPTSKNSDVLYLSLKGESSKRSEAILNMIIAKFNQDGVLDRQQVSRRTIDFIDERFLYLSTELDSIEGGKEDFKKENNLSYIEADAGISLQRKSETENEVAILETQISLSALLKKSVIEQAAFELLPVDVGLENTGLNSMVEGYNALVLQRNKLLETVGSQHPSLMAVSTQLEGAKVNIIKTINIYQTQLRTSLRQMNQEQTKVNSVFSRLPEKEKMLRSIERQQSIKENLFLLLLQKREEAAINLAVTAPSVKIVDYGLTNTIPVAPRKMVVMGIAGLLGLFLPFAFFYIKFTLNDKIESKADLLAVSNAIPFLADIPHFKADKIFTDFNDRSILAESFRILATNINYMIPKGKKNAGSVIYVTSGKMDEGKSLIAYNLSVAYASINKKVLLVGADLRSPEQHNYFKMGLSTKGLTDYLQHPESNWQDYVYPGYKDSKNHHICLSGSIPPNAPQLLSSGAFEDFITQAKQFYDIIVVDTAPTMPVTDTLLIADYADVTLFVARAGVTDKTVLQEANELNRRDKLKNMAFVLNDTQMGSKENYSYAYKDN
ncbi:capsular exopolysaccharide family [Maribacter orientalis]|uniref:Capsular exopolysaccharide family n=1 Tax=Maribacter orientalis TaxID=228957 RepID=A0A1H7N9N0_9FLAO|nr:tyrosine-protein kinase family protein [Maribacter orientalis]SEL20174.1 capsular exopolysaccharide family [Maribacter orientalis]